MKTCIICNTDIQPPKRKYCSNNCKQKAHYNKHCKNNPNTSYSQHKRADKRKKHFISLKGGKCAVCGYGKNYAALCFHHLHDKSFPLDSRNMGNRSMDSLVKEVDKCQLLCLNCHMEHHYPDLVLN